MRVLVYGPKEDLIEAWVGFFHDVKLPHAPEAGEVRGSMQHEAPLGNVDEHGQELQRILDVILVKGIPEAEVGVKDCCRCFSCQICPFSVCGFYVIQCKVSICIIAFPSDVDR